jgi:BirA family transcriptional regulator, biotin operon repressor / biotin---[acetyl-CoA-carboxylase] ligase
MKQTVLQILSQNPGFVSGAAISRDLGVTRAAVWKMVKALQQDGYPIEAVTRRGYHLTGPADILNEAELQAVLQAPELAACYPWLEFVRTTDSTNLMARRAFEQGKPSGSLFVAECQQAGRGRRGRTWLSDSHGLWFSLLLRPSAEAAQMAKLTLFCGLCVAEALQQDLQVDVGLKWPNDGVSRKDGRKLCGMLTEMIVEDQTAAAVIIGIGINVNTTVFPEEIRDTATSLVLASGRVFRRTEVLAAVLRRFAARFPDYQAADRWLDDYRAQLLTLGRPVLVIPSGQPSFAGTAVALDDDGELVVDDESGIRHTVLSGEVSVRGLLGYH